MRTLAVIALLSRVAFAEPTPFEARSPNAVALAKQLFDEGRLLLADNKIEEACAKFRESWLHEQAPGTGLNLADCEERAGHLSAAWALFDRVAAMSERTNYAARAVFARGRAEALAPKLGRLEIALADPPEGIVVTINGAISGLVSYVTPSEPVEIVVRKERRSYRYRETVETGGTLTIDVPPLANGVLAPPPPPPPPPARFLDVEGYETTHLVLGVGAFGVALVGIGMSIKDDGFQWPFVAALGTVTGVLLIGTAKYTYSIRAKPTAHGAVATLQMSF